MATVTQLLQQRAKVHDSMREAIRKRDELRTKSNDPNAGEEYNQEFDRADAEFTRLSDDIRRLERAEAVEKEAAARHITDLEDRGQKPAPSAEMEYRDAFKLFFTGKQMDNEARAILEKRGTDSQVVGTAGLGGYLVPTEYMRELIVAMKSFSGIMQVARVLNTDSGATLYIPTEDDTSTSASLITEGSSITVQDITFAQKQLDAYKYASQVKYSWELMQDSAFNVEQEIIRAFGPRFGRAINTACTTGTGSSQPNGVVTASTLGKTAAATTAITFAEIMDLYHSVDPAYRMSPTCGFMLNDGILAAIKKLQLGSGDATPLWLPSVRQGEPDTILGKPYWINQAMESAMTAAKKVMLFGDYNYYIIRIAKGLTTLRQNELFSANGLVGFAGYMRIDGECVNTAAIKHLITAAS